MRGGKQRTKRRVIEKSHLKSNPERDPSDLSGQRIFTDLFLDSQIRVLNSCHLKSSHGGGGGSDVSGQFVCSIWLED